jgi:hypothetical protein
MIFDSYEQERKLKPINNNVSYLCITEYCLDTKKYKLWNFSKIVISKYKGVSVVSWMQKL